MNDNFYTLDTWDGTLHYFPKDPSDIDKYLVCTCAKNENAYIIEFINHYLKLGFDKIIICDNNDNDSLDDLLKDYVERGEVTIYNCRGFDSFQVQFYSMFCKEGNYKWCAYFDCDEFLELGVYSNIKDYLATKENEICISFNWMMFNSNGEGSQRPGDVQERFPLPTSPIGLFTENVFLKSIVRGGDTFKNGCWFNGSHVPMVEGMYRRSVGGYYDVYSDTHQSFPPRYKEGYIKHYYTKSLEEWIGKSNRGWPDGTANLRTSNFFLLDNWSNFNIEKMVLGLFSDMTLKDLKEENYDSLNEWDVFHITNSNKHIYALMLGLFKMMYKLKGKTFILTDEHIDDTLFNLFLEMGFKTGNKVVWAYNHNDIWNCYLKYNKGTAGTYYIIDFA